jgi:hypothetical protein
MSVTGLCQVCEGAEADHQCPRCGALVCGTHYEDGKGVCVDCAAAVPDRNRDGDRPGDGDTYQF